LPHWNWKGKEGQTIPVFVYTNGDCAELFLNGKSFAKRCKKPESDKSYEPFRIIWDDVKYEPGELKAVAYQNGEKIGETFVKTAGEAFQLKLTPDRSLLQSNGTDLCFILVEAFDKDGNLCPLSESLIHFKVEGGAVIEAVGNGNPQSSEPFIADYRKLFNGKAMLIVRTMENQQGNIKVTATSEGLKPGEVSLISNLIK
jgi:beta-galactosidase